MFRTPPQLSGHPRVSSGSNPTPNTPLFTLVTSRTVAWGWVGGKAGLFSQCFLSSLSLSLSLSQRRSLRLSFYVTGFCGGGHRMVVLRCDTLHVMIHTVSVYTQVSNVTARRRHTVHSSLPCSPLPFLSGQASVLLVRSVSACTRVERRFCLTRQCWRNGPVSHPERRTKRGHI